MKYYKFYFL